MRYVYIPVYARNIHYTASTKRFLSKLLTLAKTPQVKWFVSKKLDLYLRNEYKSSGLHKRYNPEQDEDWVPKALERGDEIHDIDISDADRTKLENLVSFLNHYPEQQKLRNLSIADIEKKYAKAVEQLEKEYAAGRKQRQAGLPNTTIHVYLNNYKWVELTNPQDIKSCGEKMQNCLKDHQFNWATKVAEKQVRLFVLFDAKDQPHIALLMLRNGYIDQIRGKQNQPIVSRYLKYLQDFIQHKYVKFSSFDTGELLVNGFVLTSNGKLISTATTRNNSVVIQDNVVLANIDIVRDGVWPTAAELKIDGDLEIRHCEIIYWPEKLQVTGCITLTNVVTGRQLPSNIKCGSIIFNGVTGLQFLPENLETEELYIFDTPDLQTLPDNLTATTLILTSKKITKLPKKLTAENLSLVDSNVTSLPPDLVVKDTMYLKDSRVLYNIKNNLVAVPKGVAHIDVDSYSIIE